MPETPQQYTARMLALAGSRDPFRTLSATPGKLARMLARQSAATLRRAAVRESGPSGKSSLIWPTPRSFMRTGSG